LGPWLARRLPHAARRVPGYRNSTNWRRGASQEADKCCQEGAGLQNQHQLEAQGQPAGDQEAQKANIIDFHRFSFILGGFRASWGRRLEQPVTTCGSLFRTFTIPHFYYPCNQDDAIKQAALCSIGKLQSAGWEIARYCSDG